MDIEKITVNAFCLIGKTGSTEDGPNIVSKLWQDATEHFSEVAHLAKKNDDEQPVGFWGAMTRQDMSFLPWEDDFTRGLYMAGVEAQEEAIAPEGWRKWIIPGFECLKVPVEGQDTFREMINWMKENNIDLVAAVQDFTDPATGKNYMLFPTAWNDSKKKLIEQQKAKTAPVAYCGFHCGHCFLMEWCGYCRSACNMCSFATLSSDNRCENEKCCTEKGMDGCYDCPELETCKKGFFGTADGRIPKAASMFIRKYGKEEYAKVLENEEKLPNKLEDEKDTEGCLRYLEDLR